MFAERLICSWIGAFGLAAGAFGQTYVPIVSPAATSRVHPQSINNNGAITGFFLQTGVGPQFGFVFEGGAIRSFFAAPLPLNAAFAYSISDAGYITGYYGPNIFPENPSSNNHGFVRDPLGNVTSFDPPRSINTHALSINAAGAITGYYNEANLVIHGFVREPGGHIIPFDAPGVSTKALSINAGGAIAGYYITFGPQPDVSNVVNHGFVREPSGHIISFDPPGSTGTIVAGINDAGAITGSYTVASGRQSGFVRQPGGTIQSFDVPGSLGTAAFSINNNGDITGSYSDNAGLHGFIRSAGGAFTPFDPPFILTSTISCGLPGPSGVITTTHPTSINDAGVITGFCDNPGSAGSPFTGWVRYPM